MHRYFGLSRVLARLAAATVVLASVVLPGYPAAAAGAERAHAALVISYRSAFLMPAQAWTLTCAPTGGTHPAPAAACARLAALEDPFAPVPAEASCTSIYGGPATAAVTGTVGGERVTATFDRRGGCAIVRWNAHAPIIAPTRS